MALDVFEEIAETVFPFVTLVELNSQGDPLLYRHIHRVFEEIQKHKCLLRVQTNGTLFSSRVIDLLLMQHGVVSLSIDAIGPLFDQVRVGGRWHKAEPRIRELSTRRDRDRLQMALYPTVTARTVVGMLDTVKWAHDAGIDSIEFHDYVPISRSVEAPPPADELLRQIDLLRDYVSLQPDCPGLSINGAVLNRQHVKAFEPIDPRKRELQGMGPNYPTEHGGDPLFLCSAPINSVDIEIDGQITACCRTQTRTLGSARTIESFVRAWMGKNYRSVRESLTRNSSAPLVLPDCGPCLAFYVPNTPVGGLNGPVAGTTPSRVDTEELDFIPIWFPVEEAGYCYRTQIPSGVKAETFVLYEEDEAIGVAAHRRDDVICTGGGQFFIDGETLYFSSSDNKDIRKTGRSYSLRRAGDKVLGALKSKTNAISSSLDTGTLTFPTVFQSGGGNAFTFSAISVPGGDNMDFPQRSKMRLLEDGVPIGPAHSLHDDIRQIGLGRYSHWNEVIYFSASDNSDPNNNGRTYQAVFSSE